MSLSEQTSRVANGGKNTLKAILEKMGATVPDTTKIDGYPALAAGVDNMAISAATKALYGLGSDAVPDDVLKEIPNKVGFQVGDTLSTVRTDLGDKWLLCNGEESDTELYPDLAQMIKPSLLYGPYESFVAVSQDSPDYFVSKSPLFYINGYYIFGGINSYYGSSCIAYSQSADGPWTVKKLWDGGSGASAYNNLQGVTKVIYANGNYIAIGMSSDDTGTVIKVAYSATIDGDWTAVNAYNSGSRRGSCPEDIIYADGKYVICGTVRIRSYYNAAILHSTKLSGPWTYEEMIESNSDGSRLYCIRQLNGYLVAVGQDSSENKAVILYTNSSNLSKSNWTTVHIEEGMRLRDVQYIDGKYIVVNYDSNLYTSESLDGPWEESTHSLAGLFASNSTNNFLYNEDLYIVAGKSRDNPGNAVVAFAETLDGEWKKEVIDTFDIVSDRFFDIAFSNNTYFISIKRTSAEQNLSDFSSSRICMTNNKKFQLPEISIDGVYTYIKAKEGL